MNQDMIVGLLALGVPLFAVGYLMLRQNVGVFRMFVAMLLIGLGYLTATGAISDIGRKLMGSDAVVVPVEAPAANTAPAADAPAAETPAPAAETPAAEPPATTDAAPAAPADDAAGEPPAEVPAAPADDAPPSEGEPAPPANP
ncbi:MAG: hypothetical protein IPL91_07740 [Hyphomicrobium sp.]|jgi:hypothetical protein|nr:hypothetical protein [Hyphomicrobium sp.]